MIRPQKDEDGLGNGQEGEGILEGVCMYQCVRVCVYVCQNKYKFGSRVNWGHWLRRVVNIV